MTRSNLDPSNPTLRVEDALRSAGVEHLARLMETLPEGAVVTVDLTHARNVDAHALARLQHEVMRQASLGREVRLRGITEMHRKFLELLRPRLALSPA